MPESAMPDQQLSSHIRAVVKKGEIRTVGRAILVARFFQRYLYSQGQCKAHNQQQRERVSLRLTQMIFESQNLATALTRSFYARWGC